MDFLSGIIDRTALSTKSVRSTLLIAVVASILAFISVFNTLEFGWFTSRADLHKQMEEWCNNEPDSIELAENTKLDRWHVWFEGQKKVNPKYCEDLEDDEVKFWKDRRNNALYTVDVPWLGIQFDINDLGLFTGIALIVIMLTLNYNMILKHQNLSKSISMIKRLETTEERRNYFDLLASSQIINLPSAKKRTELPWVLKFISRALLSLPVIAHGFIFFVDVNSVGKVLYINFQYVLFTTIAAGILLVILLFQTIGCYRVETQTDRLWEGVIKDLFGDKN